MMRSFGTIRPLQHQQQQQDSSSSCSSSITLEDEEDYLSSSSSWSSNAGSFSSSSSSSKRSSSYLDPIVDYWSEHQGRFDLRKRSKRGIDIGNKNRNHSSTTTGTTAINDNDDDDEQVVAYCSTQQNNNKRKRTRQRTRQCQFSKYSSYFLGMATCLWFSAQIYNKNYDDGDGGIPNNTWIITTKTTTNTLQAASRNSNNYKATITTNSIHNWTTSNNGGGSIPTAKYNSKKKKKRLSEEIPNDCHYQSWQMTSYPNCNELHQLDLTDLMLILKQQKPQQHGTSFVGDTNNKTTRTTRTTMAKYLSSGLWRDVWSLQDIVDNNNDNDNDNNKLVVLKMMKRQHDITNRNIERHKREAIIMEQLTFSPYIVNLYSHCGTTILTEYLFMDLDHYLQPITRKRRRKRRNGTTTTTTTTPQQRIKLAYQTAKALDDLHKFDTIHADLQSKQFLVGTTTTTKSGDDDDGVHVKLNDFNRCRFLPRKTNNNNNDKNNNSSTTTICPISIPSAPGLSRSPEEYELKNTLTTAMDMYSLANVWFEILTGTIPWLEHQPSTTTTKIKSFIMDGMQPPIIISNNNNNSKEDEFMIHWLSRMYEVNPQKRVSAKSLVQEMERQFGM